MMKRLLAVILVLALGWSGWWAVGAWGAKRGLEAWFETRREAGWQADYGDFRVTGFPNRFDAIWQDLALADPQAGLALEMPQFGLFSLSYRPTHILAVWPDEMLLRTPVNNYPLTSDDLRASLRLQAGPALELRHAQLSGSALAIGGGEPARMEALSLAMVQQDGDEGRRYRLGLRAEQVQPPARLLERLGRNVALPPVLQALNLDAHVTFDRPWDRRALEEARPQPRRIDLTLARAEWGELMVQATGELTVDDQGVPEGTVSLQARNWRRMLEIAQEAGALAPGLARTVESAFDMAARMSGSPENLDVTLSLRGGMITLGPVPLAPAPRIYLR